MMIFFCLHVTFSKVTVRGGVLGACGIDELNKWSQTADSR